MTSRNLEQRWCVSQSRCTMSVALQDLRNNGLVAWQHPAAGRVCREIAAPSCLCWDSNSNGSKGADKGLCSLGKEEDEDDDVGRALMRLPLKVKIRARTILR
ncbi:hypothetical protein AAFF_G00185990 [Aldrovandia affinis]|uniref:Uncharacterized protein n=1 Tax=Aldrovandia affinis TaxID=143900 RepID=A0AAD7SXK3_9TELE|nr:hypothetical protein AAFF_G00185990 [Aldrovandia affinis]